MDASNIIVAVIAATSEKKVVGRKRLQKFSYFLNQVGGPAADDFELRQFGPYSASIAESTNELVAFGELSEDNQPLGTYGMFQSVYTLPEGATPNIQLGELKHFLEGLDKFSTLDLEIAATIDYFEKIEKDRERAVEATKSMKPTKATPSVLARAEKILSYVSEWNAKRPKNSRSDT